MKIRLQSELGMLGISIFYMAWLIVIHALSSITGVSNLLFQILGYLPIPILAWTVFSDTLRHCLKLYYPKLLLLLIVVYAGLGIYEVNKGARIDGVLGLFFLVGPMEEVLFRGMLLYFIIRKQMEISKESRRLYHSFLFLLPCMILCENRILDI